MLTILVCFPTFDNLKNRGGNFIAGGWTSVNEDRQKHIRPRKNVTPGVDIKIFLEGADG
jgi:hypothetical protein